MYILNKQMGGVKAYFEPGQPGVPRGSELTPLQKILSLIQKANNGKGRLEEDSDFDDGTYYSERFGTGDGYKISWTNGVLQEPINERDEVE